jgi:hypothetical protein
VKVVAPRPKPAGVPAAKAPERPVNEEVVMIRGNQRTVEVVGAQKSPKGSN